VKTREQAVIVKKKLSTAEFLEYANLPQNASRLLELIEGEIVEKVASFTPSEIASTISYYLKGHVLENPIGYITGADGSYVLSDEDTFMPDVAYISMARMPERPPREAPIAS
jgi:Uma2 family endonuclease